MYFHCNYIFRGEGQFTKEVGMRIFIEKNFQEQNSPGGFLPGENHLGTRGKFVRRKREKDIYRKSSLGGQTMVQGKLI